MPLLCRNCLTVNLDGAACCQNCQITGHFRPIETPTAEAGKGQKPPLDPTLADCRNCASSIDRSLAVCPVCHFQQPSRAAKNGLLKLAGVGWRN